MSTSIGEIRVEQEVLPTRVPKTHGVIVWQSDFCGSPHPASTLCHPKRKYKASGIIRIPDSLCEIALCISILTDTCAYDNEATMEDTRMPDRDSHAVDEEALFAEFGGSPNEPDEVLTVEDNGPSISDIDYARQVRAILDHPRFLVLGRDEQLLYLQLHRHCQGRGHETIRVSLADMSRWVGRAGKNVRVTMRKLRDKRLITLQHSPAPFRKGQYRIHPLESSLSSSLTALEMSNRIDQLTTVEQSTLDQQIASLSSCERATLQREASMLMLDLTAAGFSPLSSFENKAFRYLAYVKTTGLWRRARRFPDSVSFKISSSLEAAPDAPKTQS